MSGPHTPNMDSSLIRKGLRSGKANHTRPRALRRKALGVTILYPPTDNNSDKVNNSAFGLRIGA